MSTIKSWLMAVGFAVAVAPTIMASELTVNEGSATNGFIPFHFYYLDTAGCRSQVIFPASQLQEMKGQAINEIRFYINVEGYACNWKTDDMRVSMAEIDETEFAHEQFSVGTDFFDPEWTLCYSGPMEGEAGGRELVFKLSTPFMYTGSNLLVQISLGSAGNAYPKTFFLGVTTDNMPSAYTTQGYSTYGENFLPQTTFNYGELEPYEAKVSTDAITFATTLVGDEASGSVKVSNSGANPLTLTVTPPADNVFAMSDAPAELASGESTMIQFTFKPETAGNYSSTAILDLGEAGSFTIALSGKAIQAPTGYSAQFNLPDKTLPEEWTGWQITKEYDYDVYDYVNVVGEEESTDFFLAYEKDGKEGVTVKEGNHIRDYPNMIYVYMITPEIEGNFTVTATSTNPYAATQEINAYPATITADGKWNIGSEKISMQWLSDPEEGWGIALGSIEGSGYVAIEPVNMAIAGFNADGLAGDATDAFIPSLSADNLAFGEVTVGETSQKTITLTNKGTKPFTARYSIAPTAVANSDVAPSDPFAVSDEPVTVEPGISTEINVTFAPMEASEFYTTLTVSFEEGDALSVELTGTGLAKIVEVPVGTEFTVDNLDYKVTTAGEVEVTGIASGVEECEVPATVTHPDGEVLNVVGIAREAFYWSSVRKVTLPEGLRKIGYGAFRQSDLAEINLPSTLTEIGDFAFRTTSLASIEIPEGITTLGSSVFAMCEKLTDIKLPSTLTTLGSGVFYKAALSSVTLPEQCVNIAEEAFEACANLTEVSLPAALTEIKPMTFLDCAKLTSIELPSELTKIGTQAFVNTGLTSLHLPANVTNIASNSFTNAPIAEISVDAANTAFKTVEGVLYNMDGDFLYLYPRNNAETYTVADGTRGIIGGAFYKASLKTVALPSSLVGIDEMAFCNSALEQITIPEHVSVIFGQAFAGTKLTELTLPEDLTKVEEALVADCKELTTVTLPAGLTDVANRAFYGCTALTSIICKGEKPSEFDGWEGLTDPFRGVDKSKVTIYCPDNAVADYKDSEWGDFFENIKGISEMGSGVDNIFGNTTPDSIEITGGNVISINAPEAVDIRVYDMTGKIIFSSAAASATLDTLAPGLYLVKAGNAAAKVVIR